MKKDFYMSIAASIDTIKSRLKNIKIHLNLAQQRKEMQKEG